MGGKPTKRRIRDWLLVAVALGALLGVYHVTSAPPARFPSAIDPSRNSGPIAGDHGEFLDVADQAGLRYRWRVAGPRPLNILQGIGNGCAFLDYNRDGCLDILLVASPHPLLYRGDGHGHFADVTHETGLDRLTGHFLGCAVGDYDNDGYDDLYLTAYQGGALLHNEAGRRFRDVTRRSGIRPQPWGTSASFVDVDNDGRLDLYICNYLIFDANTRPQLCATPAGTTVCNPSAYRAEHGVLYRNEGRGRFRDVTRKWGAAHVTGKALGVACADFDLSGRQSLAIANDGVAGDLLANRGTAFANVGVVSGTAFDLAGRAHAGMGIDWGDFDNDGRLDLVVGTFAGEPKSVYHNEGNGLFKEVGRTIGVGDRAALYVAFGVKFLDYDNDGWLDLIFANGHIQDNTEQITRSGRYRQRLKLFHNLADGRFDDVSRTTASGLHNTIVGRGLAIGDYDNDGKMDVLVVDSEGVPLLLHNRVVNSNHWIEAKLVGTRSNRDGIGALVMFEADGRKRLRLCHTDGSYMSASDGRVHCGLGPATTVTVEVRWPDGSRDRFPNLGVDRVVNLKEGEGR
jgi:hypothetical protein